MNIIKEPDFKAARDVAVFMLQPHITIESFFYHLLSRQDIVKIIHTFFQNVNIEKLKTDIKNSVEDNESYIVENPKPSYQLEYLVKSALSYGAINDNRDLTFTDILLSIFLDDDHPFAITEILISNNIIPDLNTLEMLKQWNANMTNNNNETVVNMSEFSSFTEILNETVKSSKTFTPSIGCEDKLEEIQRTLLRTYKSSVIITGNSGVGKSNIVETLAHMINSHMVHDDLRNAKIYLLKTSHLLSDIKFHGVLEARMNNIIEVLKQNPNIILFIDEIHMLYGAGGSNSNNDIMNILKDPLSKNQIRIIGATTIHEYDKFISKNAGFQRRFANVVIDEPSDEETITILNSRKNWFNQHYKIEIGEGVVEKVVELGSNYIRNRFNPDKSVDILDSLLARKKLHMGNKVEIKDVYQEISKICRIPSDEIAKSKLTKIIKMTETLNTKIIGQKNAFERISDILAVSMSGLKGNDKTMGNFLFQGPTSCGKTETAKIISKELGIPLIRYDMSAYSERHTVATLIGSPPGYIGFNDGVGGGKLINDINQNPHCVLLLDEIEKAHPDVLKILLQVMDYGKVSSNSGKDAYFSKVIIIMTSNLGSKEAERKAIGFGSNDNSGKIDEHIKNFLAPEFRARLDAIIKFNKLSEDDMVNIARDHLNDFVKSVVNHKVTLKYNDEVVRKIAKDSFVSNLGARNIQNIITNDIKSKLARAILANETDNVIEKNIILNENTIDIA